MNELINISEGTKLITAVYMCICRYYVFTIIKL